MDWNCLSIELNNKAVEAACNVIHEMDTGGLVLDEGYDEHRKKIIVYFPADENFKDLFKCLQKKLSNLSAYGLKTGEIIYSFKLTKDEDWAKSWHKYFKALKIGSKFVICPTWEEYESAEREVIKIYPGRAFGLGGHETTKMCVELLEKYVSKQEKMLDIGTGTGILSIAAAKLGIKNITAVDISPAAVEAARRSIEINGVESFITVLKGDMFSDIEGRFSLITANLLPDLIIDLVPYLNEYMDLSAVVILAGIIEKKLGYVEKLIKDNGLNLIDKLKINEWVSLVVSKG